MLLGQSSRNILRTVGTELGLPQGVESKVWAYLYLNTRGGIVVRAIPANWRAERPYDDLTQACKTFE